MVSLFTHKKPKAFMENQVKRMKKTTEHGDCGGVHGGQLKGTTLKSLSLIVFPLIWVHFINPWPDFLVNGFALYFL